MDRVYWFLQENTYVWCGTCQRFVSGDINKIEGKEKWQIKWCHGERVVKEKPQSIYEELKEDYGVFK